MNTNHFGNEDDGANVSPISSEDTGGITLALHQLRSSLETAANFAGKLASRLESAPFPTPSASDAGEALRTAPSGCSECDEYAKSGYHPPVCPHTTPLASEWGDPIPVDGKRPEWLRDDPIIRWKSSRAHGECYADMLSWLGNGCYTQPVETIRLPASHPYYLATSRGFTYWPGGDNAPADWDGGVTLFRDGDDNPFGGAYRWNHDGYGHREADIIGYRRKPEDTGCDDDQLDMSANAVREALETAISDGTLKVATDPRAPLMAEVEKMGAYLRSRRSEFGTFTPIPFDWRTCDKIAEQLSALAGELIAQDKRFLQARTYDDDARSEAVKIIATTCFPYNQPSDVVREVQGRTIDAIADALGLQRACNNPAS